MPKIAKALGPLDIKRAAHPGNTERHHWVDVGGVSGLRLQIAASGARSWVLRTMIGGKRLGLGPYPEVGLAEARSLAAQAKAKVREGVDPIEERKAARAALAATQARTLLFSDAMDKWIIAKMADRPEKSQKAIRSTITRYALPEIGALSVHPNGTGPRSGGAPASVTFHNTFTISGVSDAKRAAEEAVALMERKVASLMGGVLADI